MEIVFLALITGAILQSIISILQYTGYYKFLGSLIFYDGHRPTTNIFGHFGQRNHYCHYLTWAVFGLIYLHLKDKINTTTFYTLIAWFMFSITIAASRTVFIYFIAATIICFIYYLFNRSTLSRTLLFLTIISSIILIIFEYGYPMLQLATHHKHTSLSGLERLAQTGINSSGLMGRRMVEWQKAWITFKNYPIFGHGLNSFAHQSVYLLPLFKNTPLNDGLFTNCHNLILQLLAETGLIGTLIIIGGIMWVIGTICSQHIGSQPKQTSLGQTSLVVVTILCIITTTFIHSMFVMCCELKHGIAILKYY